mgnify:CR=1 FL=1
MSDGARLLVILGIVLIAVGLLWPWLQKLPLGRLPGDIVVEKENFKFYFPLVTSILASLIITLIVWWLRK